VSVCIVGFFDLLRAGFAEPGTTALLNGELGAKPPPQSCKSIESDWTGVAGIVRISHIFLSNTNYSFSK